MSSSTVSRCEINPCHIRNACHSPEDVLQYPFGTPLSEPLIKLKKLLEQNCTPEKVQYIFQLIEAGNLKDIDWDEVMSTSIEDQPSDLGNSNALECSFPPCEGHPGCHAPDEILQYPFGTPLSPNLEELKKLVEENNNPDKIKQFFGELETRKLKNIDREMPMKSSIDLKPKDGPAPVSKLTSISIGDPPSDLRVSKALECRVPPCDGHPGCHAPDEVLQYPFGTPLSPALVELKKLVEENNNPEKIKTFIEQLESRKVENVNCGIPMKRTTHLEPNDGPVSVSKLTSMPNCNLPPCKGPPGCHLPDEVLQYPFGTPLPPDLLELKKLIEQNENEEKVKQLYGQLQSRNIKTCETLLKQPNNRPFLKPKEKPLRLPLNQERSECHSQEDFLNNPLGIHLSPYLVELKNLLEQNNNSKKVNSIMKQIENANLNNRDWKEEIPTNISPDNRLTSNVVPKNSISIISSCHSPKESLHHPNRYPLSPSLQTLKYILERYYSPYKVQRLFRQIETGYYKNLDWIENSTRQPLNVPTQINAPATSHFCPPNSCRKRLETSGCRSPHENLHPHGGSKSGSKVDPKVKHSHEPTESGEVENLFWMGSLTAPTSCSSDQYTSSESANDTTDCIDPRYPSRLGCHAPEKLLKKKKEVYPFVTSLPQNVSRRKKFLEENSNPKYHSSKNFDYVETLKTCTDFLSDNYPTSELMPTISTCRIPPCHGRSGCHLPDDVLRYPFGTPLPQNLEEFKRLLDHDFDPKKIKQIFEEIEAGNLENLDWECAMRILKELERHDADDVEVPPSKPMPSARKPAGATCQIPPCDGRSFCHSPDNVLQYPFGTPLPQHLEDLKKLLEDNCSPETVRHLFEQIEAGDLEDLKNIDCGEAPAIPVVIAPDVCEPSVCPTPGRPPPVCPPTGRPPPVCPPPVCLPPVCPTAGRPPPVRSPPGRPPPRRPRPGHPPPVPSPCVSVGTDYSPPSDVPLTCTPKDRKPAGQPGTLPSTVIILPPEVYVPKPKDEDCGVCHKPKYRNGIKMKCACSGKKKTVKINPPCPCELHQVPISKEEPGLKINTRSIGDQCCICDEYSSKKKKSGQDVIFKLGQTAPSIIGLSDGPVSTGVQDGTGCIICPTGMPCSSEHTTCPKLTKTTVGPVPLGFFGQPDKKSEMGELEIIGPQGGYVIVGPGGVYTQAGIKEIRFSSGAGTDPQFNNVDAESTSKVKKNCLCFGKRKKKRKIVCQCPSESDQEPLLLYTYADFEEARKQTKKFKSDLTQTTSGFKFKKKKKPEAIPEPQYTMEDAIRDYAIIRPDFIRDLVPPGTVTRKGRKKDCACESERGVDNYEILIPDGKGNFVYKTPPPEPEVVQEPPERPVLKISIGGKGSGSKGLSGICCFEMYQDP